MIVHLLCYKISCFLFNLLASRSGPKWRSKRTWIWIRPQYNAFESETITVSSLLTAAKLRSYCMASSVQICSLLIRLPGHTVPVTTCLFIASKRRISGAESESRRSKTRTKEKYFFTAIHAHTCNIFHLNSKTKERQQQLALLQG